MGSNNPDLGTSENEMQRALGIMRRFLQVDAKAHERQVKEVYSVGDGIIHDGPQYAPSGCGLCGHESLYYQREGVRQRHLGVRDVDHDAGPPKSLVSVPGDDPAGAHLDSAPV